MNSPMQEGAAIGMVEVNGLSTGVVAANLASHTAAVTVAGFGYLHDGQVMVTLRGSVDAVQAAVDAITGHLSEDAVHATSVIARPDEQVEPLLRERYVSLGGRAGAPPVPGRGRRYGASTLTPTPTEAKKAQPQKTTRKRTRRNPDA
jgi:ethanolamine utilization microcompartment shell protein EutS